MNEKQKQIMYEIRKEKLRIRMPLVVLILISFLIYNLWIPLELIKWLAVAVLAIYLAVGFYYQKEMRRELDQIADQDGDGETEIDQE
jgi:Flp pilus assembly protein TadB